MLDKTREIEGTNRGYLNNQMLGNQKSTITLIMLTRI